MLLYWYVKLNKFDLKGGQKMNNIILKTRKAYDYINKEDFIIWSSHEFGFCVDIPTVEIIMNNLNDTQESHVEKIQTMAKGLLDRDKELNDFGSLHYKSISKCIHTKK
jgi:hypothetical protein